MNAEKEAWREVRRKQDFSEELARKGWFHSFRLPDGTSYEGHLSVEELQRRVSAMPIPQDLSGQRVLDIGAWDGWYSFEMERRGADVVAMDCVAMPNFRKVHALLGSQVDYRIADIHDVTPEEFGRFNIVLFLSVLYHLKHPLLALERVCALATDFVVLSSFTSDGGTRPVEELLDEIPRLDFYETDELGGQFDNWFGPNVACLMALCRTAGFPRVELVEISGPSATLACYRKWLPASPHPSAPVRLLDALNARSSGIYFRPASPEEYIACWFESDCEAIAREEVKPEVAGYGVPCAHLCRHSAKLWQCNVRLPPGLTPGWYDVTLRVGDSRPSVSRRIAVDVPGPFVAGDLAIHSACDAFLWRPDTIVKTTDRRPVVSIWVRGLPDNADRNNVQAFLGDLELYVDAVKPFDSGTSKALAVDGAALMQVNAMLPDAVAIGRHSLTVRAGGRVSAPLTVEVAAS
jgi:tRNA (mo5U34)-methyltransferase